MTSEMARQLGMIMFWAPVAFSILYLVVHLFVRSKGSPVSDFGRIQLFVCAGICAGYSAYFALLMVASRGA